MRIGIALQVPALPASLLCLLSLAGCGSEKEDAAKRAAAAAAPVPVVIAAVEQKTVPVYAELTARTDANDSVDIRARVKAYLMAQHFQEGTEVRKGQLLFTLDKREYEAQEMQARAQLAKAEADLAQARERASVESAAADLEASLARLNKASEDVKRLKPLAEAQAVPQQDYDNSLASQRAAQAESNAKQAALNTAKVTQTAQIRNGLAAVEAAKASVRQAELNLEYCNIVSPIDGIIGTRQVAPGNLVGQGEATLLATVSNVNPTRVFASISERDYLTFFRMRAEGKRPGAAEVELLLADGSLFPHKGRVIIAGRAVDLKTGTLSIVSEFPNPGGMLRPGQFGRIRVATATDNALLVPQKAVSEMQSAKVVYVVGSDNKVQLRSVVLGARTGQDYIVTEGLKAGERIVVEGILKVRPGSLVTPAPAATRESGEAKKGA